MTSRVGPQGQVVIPKAMRDRLGITAGEEVDFTLEDGGLRIRLTRTGQSLGGQLTGLGLTAALEADHRAELGR
jgi:AbrB family looped-hinge helix DNA binding protein